MSTFILGIDISKDHFDVALYKETQFLDFAKFSNDNVGFKKLHKWLRKRDAGPLRACMEATGRYGDQLALTLYHHGHQVSVVNPARIKKYAESKLQRNKVDHTDAKIIADFCLTQNPPLWEPLPEEVQELQALCRRLNTLIEDRTREQNRLQSGIVSNTVKASIKAHLTFLNEQVAELEKQIKQHIQQHPALKNKRDLLLSIPGIGEKTAARILAELPDPSRFDTSAQVVAYGGLSPQQHTSGSSVRKRTRLTKTGKLPLKTALYFPAMTAIRLNPIVKALAQRLENRGKEKMVIIGAAMRKLLQLAYGVLKSGQPFDPDFAVNMQATI
jgi:transposase